MLRSRGVADLGDRLGAHAARERLLALIVKVARRQEADRPLSPGFSLHITHELDILFVIDNSPGNAPSQAALARAIDEMLDALSSVHSDGDRS